MRLFVGVPVSDAVRDEASSLMTKLQSVVPGARWVPP